MVDVRRVKLPGVGVLHTFVTDDGGKVGVITHRSGHSDLVTFADAEDGDARKVSLRLDEDEFAESGLAERDPGAAAAARGALEEHVLLAPRGLPMRAPPSSRSSGRKATSPAPTMPTSRARAAISSGSIAASSPWSSTLRASKAARSSRR